MNDLLNTYSCWLEINTSAFIENIRSIKEQLGNSVKLMFVLKANAYGHGAVELAKISRNEGIDCFGVARVEEGIELRKAGVYVDIHILSGVSVEMAQDIIRSDLIPSLAEYDFALVLNKKAQELGRIVSIHLKIDTGMNRYGVKLDSLEAFLDKLSLLKNLKVTGVFSHLADCENREFSNFQIANFERALKILEQKDYRNLTKHLLSSDGLINFSANQYDMVRIGRFLYELKPILTWKTRISLIKNVKQAEYIGYGCTFKTSKDMKLAIIMCGYADGLNRRLFKIGEALVCGQRCPIIGRISMDQSAIDISHLNEVKIGDEVVIIGKQGRLEITAQEVAEKLGTINYEIWTSIGQRVKRIVVHG